MPNFTFGGPRRSLIAKTWMTGDWIWRLGDRVEGDAIPGGIGIVEGVFARQKIFGPGDGTI